MNRYGKTGEELFKELLAEKKGKKGAMPQPPLAPYQYVQRALRPLFGDGAATIAGNMFKGPRRPAIPSPDYERNREPGPREWMPGRNSSSGSGTAVGPIGVPSPYNEGALFDGTGREDLTGVYQPSFGQGDNSSENAPPSRTPSRRPPEKGLPMFDTSDLILGGLGALLSGKHADKYLAGYLGGKFKGHDDKHEEAIRQFGMERDLRSGELKLQSDEDVRKRRDADELLEYNLQRAAGLMAILKDPNANEQHRAIAASQLTELHRSDPRLAARLGNYKDSFDLATGEREQAINAAKEASAKQKDLEDQQRLGEALGSFPDNVGRYLLAIKTRNNLSNGEMVAVAGQASLYPPEHVPKVAQLIVDLNRSPAGSPARLASAQRLLGYAQNMALELRRRKLDGSARALDLGSQIKALESIVNGG